MPEGASASVYRHGSQHFTATPTSIRSADRDLVVLDHNIPPDQYLELEPANTPDRPLAQIVALGFPDFAPGDELSRTPGQVIRSGARHGVQTVQVSAILTSGLSGGPIVNERQQVIAIVRAVVAKNLARLASIFASC